MGGVVAYCEPYSHGFNRWLKEYSDSGCDILMISHCEYNKDESDSLPKERWSLLEPCEVLTEEEWIHGGLTPWIDDLEAHQVAIVHVDGTQGDDAMLEASKLEEPLHFKTTSTWIIAGQDVKDYPKVPLDWYQNNEEQTHVIEKDWKYMDVTMCIGNIRKIKMRSRLGDDDMKEYGFQHIRQKERRMNPQLQLLVKVELERLLEAGFIKPV
ncbi:hypothetical protein AXG93_4118s1110 [Marchantia polymorpha subsp. ruderalis]|uniref:Uncharacterized protein n=1 Tax=Marchantia polymorpha subsp. ruderalis TaxID=1480154 RepID=A0A176W0T8_MARPO|nr:hypothetical protein AXG93_4118s1110 [Marchantia polymorpha subsp. ruderalis]